MTKQHCGNELAVENPDGIFPNTNAVIPNRADMDCIRISFDPAIMARTMTAIAEMGSPSCTIDLSMHYGENEGIEITAQAADGSRIYRGVVMPTDPQRPGWPDARKLYDLLRRFATEQLGYKMKINDDDDDEIKAIKTLMEDYYYCD